MDAGRATIEDQAELSRIRRQASRVHVKALAVAAAFAFAVWLVPYCS